MFVRWESQSVEAAHDPRLPGFSEDVVVRRFDAPEALDTRFHEVRTKSAINRVPTISRVPFEWTVNPYRGCSHACLYCAKRRSTPVLMADGSHRALGDLRWERRFTGQSGKVATAGYVRTDGPRPLDARRSVRIA